MISEIICIRSNFNKIELYYIPDNNPLAGNKISEMEFKNSEYDEYLFYINSIKKSGIKVYKDWTKYYEHINKK